MLMTLINLQVVMFIIELKSCRPAFNILHLINFLCAHLVWAFFRYILRRMVNMHAEGLGRLLLSFSGVITESTS